MLTILAANIIVSNFATKLVFINELKIIYNEKE